MSTAKMRRRERIERTVSYRDPILGKIRTGRPTACLHRGTKYFTLYFEACLCGGCWSFPDWVEPQMEEIFQSTPGRKKGAWISIGTDWVHAYGLPLDREEKFVEYLFAIVNQVCDSNLQETA